MNPIRVLVVDDSALARRVITRALAAHADVTVVGTAESTEMALLRLARLAPDAVVLDVEMPITDGLATLTRIRELYPRLPVLAFGTPGGHSARATSDALEAGANDYALKPPSPIEPGADLERAIAEGIVPKLRAMVRETVVAPRP
jgi:two-component system, chemotaxis family, protein-glutamate methylesterase/glutaminase